MMIRSDIRPTDIGHEAALFIGNVLKASALTFFWPIRSDEHDGAATVGDMDRFIREYRSLFPVGDPLVEELKQRKIQTVCLSTFSADEYRSGASERYREMIAQSDYHSMLNGCGFYDEINFVFRHDTDPIAILTRFDRYFEPSPFHRDRLATALLRQGICPDE